MSFSLSLSLSHHCVVHFFLSTQLRPNAKAIAMSMAASYTTTKVTHSPPCVATEFKKGNIHVRIFLNYPLLIHYTIKCAQYIYCISWKQAHTPDTGTDVHKYPLVTPMSWLEPQMPDYLLTSQSVSQKTDETALSSSEQSL